MCPGPDADESQEGKLKRLKQFKAAEKRSNARCYAFVSDTVCLGKDYVEKGFPTETNDASLYTNTVQPVYNVAICLRQKSIYMRINVILS